MMTEEYEPQAKLFKALNHPVRLAILDILRGGEACVCHFEALLRLRQSYISQQLMILREAGLVQDRREGMNIYYRAVQPGVYAVIDTAGRETGSLPVEAQSRPGIGDAAAACECPKCKASAAVPAG